MDYTKYNNLDIDTIKVLVIDDDDQVLEVTKFVLDDYSFMDKPLEIIEATTQQEALELIEKNQDIAVVFVDIIMEEDDSGLQFINTLRNIQENHHIRLIIRTGQPGIFPPEDIFFNYDINDYLNKNDLSHERLILSLTSAIRGYFDIKLIEKVSLQKLEQEKILLSQSKNAVLGEMIQAITHQWTQPLAMLKVSTEYIEFDFDDSNALKKSISNIKKQIVYMSRTLKDFKNFFSPDKQKYRFNIVDAVSNAQTIVSNKSFKIVLEEQKEFFIYGSINELSQVFIILFNNSIDAMKENKIENGEIDISFVQNTQESIIYIKDNAGGIKQEVLDKLFSKYNTSKSNGTGIGLYIVKLIIENEFSGKIGACNTDEGACFKITLPQSEEE